MVKKIKSVFYLILGIAILVAVLNLDKVIGNNF